MQTLLKLSPNRDTWSTVVCIVHYYSGHKNAVPKQCQEVIIYSI